MVLCYCLGSPVLSCFSQIKIIKPDHFSTSPSELDVKIINNSILVPVDLNYNLRLYFLLDTGVSTVIITEPIIIDLLNLEILREIKLNGYGDDEPIDAYVSHNFEFRLNDHFQFRDRDVIILKERVNLDYFFGVPVYGLIGYDFLKDYEVTIDFQREKLYLKKPRTEKKVRKLKRKKKVEVLDLIMEGTKPFVQLKINHQQRSDSVKLLIDTGFSGALSLFPSEMSEQYNTKPNIEHYSGYGLNGKILSTFKKLNSLEVGKRTKLKNVSSNFLDSTALRNIQYDEYSDGSIGNDILKRFKVTLDYKNNRLILRPVRREIKKPFFYNLCGLRIFLVESEEGIWHFFIDSVREDSDADLAGVQHGDLLLEINGKKLKHLSISKVYELLNNFSETQRSLLVDRDGQLMQIDFQVEPIEEWN